MRGAFLFLLATCMVLLLGCGGSGGGSGTTRTLSLQTSNPNIRVGQTTIFTALLEGGLQTVTWSVVGGASNGTITADGTYTAPATPGTYTVRAALRDDPSKTATANVTVLATVVVSIDAKANLPRAIPRSKIYLTASVTGATDQGVTWTVNGLGSLVDSAGVFTAPATLGTYTVQARSKADPSKTDTATITVVPNLNVRLMIEGKPDIMLSLRPDKAPNTVANFVSLVNKKFYDGLLFHRYVPGFVIQGGDPISRGPLGVNEPNIGTGGPGYLIDFEANDLLHDKYALAMARAGGRNTAGSQFYLTLDPQPSLDGDYVVFGHLLSGDTVVDSLRAGDKILQATTELP